MGRVPIPKKAVSADVETAEKEIDRLGNIKASLEAQLSALSLSLKRAKGELEEVSYEVLSKRKEQTFVEEALKEKTAERAGKDTELRVLSVQLEEIKAELDKTANKIALSQENERLCRLKVVQKHEERVGSLRDQIKRLEDQINELQAVLAEQKEAGLILKHTTGEEVIRRQKEALALKGDIEKATKELQKLKVLEDKKDSMVAKLAKATADLQTKKDELKEMDKKLADAEKALHDVNKKKIDVDFEMDKKIALNRRLEEAVNLKTVQVQRMLEDSKAEKYFADNKI